MRALISAFLILMACSIAASAMDQLYGAGTLPKMADAAQVVFEVKDVEIATENNRRVVFAVTAMKPWKGTPAEGPIFVVCPKAGSVPTVNDLSDVAIFLRGPLDERQRRYWEIPDTISTAYQFVNGARGIVSLREPLAARRYALATYLKAADQPNPVQARIKWAKKNVKNSDLLLQESALFELGRQTESADILATLSATISTSVAPTTAAHAVTLVGDSASANAIEVLVNAVANKNLNQLVRRQAVIELLQRADGAAALRSLIEKDSFVASLVTELREP